METIRLKDKAGDSSEAPLDVGKRAGFTLVEVLVATAIFVVGVLGIFALEVRSTKLGAQARWLAEANRLAQFPIEAFRNAPFNEIYTFTGASGATTTYTTTTAPTFTADTTAQRVALDWRSQMQTNFPQGVGTWKIEIVRGAADDLEAIFTVKVTWKDIDRQHEIEMTGRMANAY